MSEVALPDQFRGFAADAARDDDSTYDIICRSVADDAELLELIGQAPLAQRRPNLLLAAVHFLLLGGAQHPLAAYYDTVAEFTGNGIRTGTGAVAHGDGVGRQFKDFCLTHREALLALIATGSTQTNEVGRCTALLPALSYLAAAHPGTEPMGLLDLGTSAGLNLLFDRYAYTYRPRSAGDVPSAGAVRTAGDPASPVHLDCSVGGELSELPPLRSPEVVDRAGLDLAPIDPGFETGRRWLLACVWPGNLARFERLRAALDIARTDPRRPTLHTGDIVDNLDAVSRTVAPGRPLVVFHSWVAAYLTEARQRELVDAVCALSATRPVHYLYAESSFDTPGLPTPPPPRAHASSHLATALVHLRAGGDRTAAVRLADMHPHGRWLRWWVPPTPRAGPTGRHDEPESARRPR